MMLSSGLVMQKVVALCRVFGLSVCLVMMPGLSHAAAQDLLNAFVEMRQQADGEFTQVVVGNNGAVKQRSAGQFSFSRPGKFRWEITKPYPLLVMSNGQHVVSYDADMQHATKKPLGNAMDSTPVALLFGNKNVDKLFVLQSEGNKDGLEWLKVTPKDKETLFDYVRLGWQNGLPVALEIHDSLGQITKLTLKNWQFNQPRPAGHYEFKPPVGVDLIETR